MIDDLYWILNSPSLMRTPEAIQGWDWLLKQINQDSTHTATSTSSENKRLGIYYEDNVFQLLSESFDNSRLERNIQVTSNKITVGEFDFVGHTPLADFHLECAVKFYLRVGSGEQLNHFIGPGKKDRLDIKWARLLNHQLPLSDSVPGKAKLNELGIFPSEKVLLLQGYLFHPLESPDPVQLAAEINPEHLKGWWLRASQLHLLDKHSHYAVMDKPHWLTPRIDTALNFTELCLQAGGFHSPQLLSRGNWVNDRWEETDRGFIVPENW